MKPLSLALGAATVVVFATVIGFAAYGEIGWDAPWLFIYSDLIAKVVILLSLIVTVRSALPFGQPKDAIRRLHSMALLVAGLGLLVSAITLISPKLINSNNPTVTMLAPDYAQDLMPLAFGLLAATVATARASKQPPSA